MPDMKQIHDFAVKWCDKFRDQNINYIDLVDHFMALCTHLLFTDSIFLYFLMCSSHTWLSFFLFCHTLSAQQSYFRHHTDPSFLSTTNTVLNSILMSSPMFQFSMYSLSSLTTSSKSVMSLRPLTCHMPVMPGLMASRAR